MNDANDPIPADAISLVDAFDYLFRAMTANWKELEERCNEPVIALALNLNENSNEEMNRQLMGDAFPEYDQALLKANIWLRSCIGNGGITAFIRDPLHDKQLQLQRQGWDDVGFCRSGISSNFVAPNDLMDPGPDSEIDGFRRPVFFMRNDFEKLIALAFGSGDPLAPDQGFRSRRGRPSLHDWDEARHYAEKIYAERGDFADVQNQCPGWRTATDFAHLIMEHMSRLNDRYEPPFSSAKSFVSGFLKMKRAGRK
jgi:hypothetical protein